MYYCKCEEPEHAKIFEGGTLFCLKCSLNIKPTTAMTAQEQTDKEISELNSMFANSYPDINRMLAIWKVKGIIGELVRLNFANKLDFEIHHWQSVLAILENKK